MYRINEIKLNLDESMDMLPNKILRKIGNKNLFVTEYNVVKESIDARDKADIKKVYTVDFQVSTRAKPKKFFHLKANPKLKLEVAPDMTYKDVESGSETLKNRPVIVGFGPCGMFSALILASRGYRPIVLERGSKVETRVEKVDKFWNDGVLDENCNVQFGEGGAGTFSDGKLTTGIKDYRIRKVLEEFTEAGADKDILYKAKPHIGTDVLRVVVKNLREKIIKLGGEIYFDTKMTEILCQGNSVVGLKAVKDGEEITIETENIIIAVGHSARDTFRMLYNKGVEMCQKPFSMGVRVEHLQEIIDKAQYGNTKGLPPADYKLSYHCKNGRGVYTFCMCPGGEVVMASSESNTVVTNGMSNRNRDSGIANSALLCEVKTTDFPSEHPLAGIEFQEKYEHLAYENSKGYNFPMATWKEFQAEDPASQTLLDSLPDFVRESFLEAMPALGKKLRGFDSDDTVMKGVETRSSSPVRFTRDREYQGNLMGIYPGGEGAGYAGGIMSAACDGIKIAERIIEKYAPREND